MFFDKDQSNRRVKEIAYRNQLKNQIQFKNSKVLNNNRRNETNSQPSTFSLVANIQIAEEARKNKQSQYYAELRNQIQKQKQQKKRAKDEKARRQREQEQKIRRDNELLKQKYEEQIKKQGRKKGQPEKNNTSTLQKSLKSDNKINHIQHKGLKEDISKQPEFRRRNIVKLQTSNQRLYTSESQNQQGELPLNTAGFNNLNISSVPYIHTYINKIENEPYNFLPQRRHMNNYFQELLGQRRMLEQEASGIAELNRLFFQEKSRASKIESRGLDELRNLHNILEQKGANYMQNSGNNNIINLSSRFKNSGIGY